MNKIIIFLCFTLLSGCSIFQFEEPYLVQPKLVKQTALPPITQFTHGNKYEFDCQLVITEHGDVESVKILTSSGNVVWDSLAELSILNWKFTPALMNNKPVRLFIRRKLVVMYEEPVYLSLAEIQINDYNLADSVYEALKAGADFSEIAAKFSVSPSRELKGYIGKIDIKHYAKEISEVLAKLEIGEITKPLKFGDSYIIFKRLKD